MTRKSERSPTTTTRRRRTEPRALEAPQFQPRTEPDKTKAHPRKHKHKERFDVV